MLDRRGRESLEKRGITVNDLEEYNQILKTGYPFISLSACCSACKEIKKFVENERREWRELYRNDHALKVIKIVPASGAASRMFKELFAAIETGNNAENVNQFFDTLKDYAFAEELLERTGLDQKSQ